jgi:23S rRNA pseudouridine2605 synthase
LTPTERLQKVLAAAGIASRRASEDIIRQGRVQVNGRIILEQGVKVDPAVDKILVDGVPLPKVEPPVYILLHKPVGVLSTASDERGRETVLDLVPAAGRLYPVGRLDIDSEGLILLTNDGDLTDRLTHPRYGHTREYRVLVQGHPLEGKLQKMRRGMVLEDGPTGLATVEVVDRSTLNRESLPLPERDDVWLQVVVKEGRKRQVRRMCEIIGHPVKRLIRVAMGPLTLGSLPPGKYRPLKPEEIRQLRALAEPEKTKAPRARRRPRSATPPIERRGGGRERRETGPNERRKRGVR